MNTKTNTLVKGLAVLALSCTLAHTAIGQTFTWDTPDPISYGTPLSATQLNAVVRRGGQIDSTAEVYYFWDAPEIPAAQRALVESDPKFARLSNQTVSVQPDDQATSVTNGFRATDSPTYSIDGYTGTYDWLYLDAGTHTLTAYWVPGGNASVQKKAVKITVRKASLSVVPSPGPREYGEENFPGYESNLAPTYPSGRNLFVTKEGQVYNTQSGNIVVTNNSYRILAKDAEDNAPIFKPDGSHVLVPIIPESDPQHYSKTAEGLDFHTFQRGENYATLNGRSTQPANYLSAGEDLGWRQQIQIITTSVTNGTASTPVTNTFYVGVTETDNAFTINRSIIDRGDRVGPNVQFTAGTRAVNAGGSSTISTNEPNKLIAITDLGLTYPVGFTNNFLVPQDPDDTNNTNTWPVVIRRSYTTNAPVEVRKQVTQPVVVRVQKGPGNSAEDIKQFYRTEPVGAVGYMVITQVPQFKNYTAHASAQSRSMTVRKAVIRIAAKSEIKKAYGDKINHRFDPRKAAGDEDRETDDYSIITKPATATSTAQRIYTTLNSGLLKNVDGNNAFHLNNNFRLGEAFMEQIVLVVDFSPLKVEKVVGTYDLALFRDNRGIPQSNRDILANYDILPFEDGKVKVEARQIQFRFVGPEGNRSSNVFETLYGNVDLDIELRVKNVAPHLVEAAGAIEDGDFAGFYDPDDLPGVFTTQPSVNIGVNSETLPAFNNNGQVKRRDNVITLNTGSAPNHKFKKAADQPKAHLKINRRDLRLRLRDFSSEVDMDLEDIFLIPEGHRVQDVDASGRLNPGVLRPDPVFTFQTETGGTITVPAGQSLIDVVKGTAGTYRILIENQSLLQTSEGYENTFVFTGNSYSTYTVQPRGPVVIWGNSDGTVNPVTFGNLLGSRLRPTFIDPDTGKNIGDGLNFGRRLDAFTHYNLEVSISDGTTTISNVASYIRDADDNNKIKFRERYVELSVGKTYTIKVEFKLTADGITRITSGGTQSYFDKTVTRDVTVRPRTINIQARDVKDLPLGDPIPSTFNADYKNLPGGHYADGWLFALDNNGDPLPIKNATDEKTPAAFERRELDDSGIRFWTDAPNTDVKQDYTIFVEGVTPKQGRNNVVIRHLNGTLSIGKVPVGLSWGVPHGAAFDDIEYGTPLGNRLNAVLVRGSGGPPLGIPVDTIGEIEYKVGSKVVSAETVLDYTQSGYEVKAKFKANDASKDNYTDSAEVARSLQVTRKLLILAVANTNKVYGDANPAFMTTNGIGAGALQTPVVVTSDVGKISIQMLVPAEEDQSEIPVGTNQIVIQYDDTENRLQNYELQQRTGTLTVEAREVEVRAADRQMKVGTANVSDFLNDFTDVLNVEEGTRVSSRIIFENIAPHHATALSKPRKKEKGEDETDGFDKLGEFFPSLALISEITATNRPGDSAPINVQNVGASGSLRQNYVFNISTNLGTLTIVRKVPTIQWASFTDTSGDDDAIMYGQRLVDSSSAIKRSDDAAAREEKAGADSVADKTFDWNPLDAVIEESDARTGTLEYTFEDGSPFTSDTAPRDAGTLTLTATYTPAGGSDYGSTSKTIEIVIHPRPVTIGLKNQEVEYGYEDIAGLLDLSTNSLGKVISFGNDATLWGENAQPWNKLIHGDTLEDLGVQLRLATNYDPSDPNNRGAGDYYIAVGQVRYAQNETTSNLIDNYTNTITENVTDADGNPVQTNIVNVVTNVISRPGDTIPNRLHDATGNYEIRGPVYGRLRLSDGRVIQNGIVVQNSGLNTRGFGSLTSLTSDRGKQYDYGLTPNNRKVLGQTQQVDAHGNPITDPNNFNQPVYTTGHREGPLQFYAARLTVQKAPLTIKPQDFEKTQGEQGPTGSDYRAVVFTDAANTNVIKFSDELTVRSDNNENGLLQTPLRFISGVNRDTPPGRYPITISGGTSDNYILTHRQGEVIVYPSIQWNPASLTYGTKLGAAQLNATSPSSSGTFTYLTNQAGLRLDTNTVLSVGTHTLSASLALDTAPARGANQFNATATVQVNSAVLTVTANDVTRKFEEANPNFSATIDGFVNEEDESVLVGELTYETEGIDGANAAIYPLSVAGVTASNYNITFVPGIVTIEKSLIEESSASVTLTDLTQAYDGNPKGVTVTKDPANLALRITYNGQATVPTNPGVYEVVATAVDPRYAGSVTNTMRITDATVITLSNLEQTYDGQPKPVTVTVTTSLGLDTNTVVDVTYDGAADVPVDAGVYAVQAVIGGGNTVYSGMTTNVLTINQAVATVSFAADSLTQTIGNLTGAIVETTPIGLVYRLDYEGTTNNLPLIRVGEYAVEATIVDANWVGSATNIFTVEREPQTISVFVNDRYGLQGVPLNIALFARATSNSTNLPVTFRLGANTAAGTGVSIDGNLITARGPGLVEVIASVASDSYWAAAEETFTIQVTGDPLDFSIEFGGLEQTYDGDPKLITVTTKPAGLQANITYAGESEAPSNAGIYPVQVEIPAYNKTTNATLTINKAAAAISFVTSSTESTNLLEQPVNDITALEATTDPAGLSYGVTYAGSTDLPDTVGDFEVIASIVDANRTGSVTNTLTVTRAPQTVTPVFLSTYTIRGVPLEIALFANTSSSLPVVFEIGNADATVGASITGSVLRVRGPGAIEVKAIQLGDDYWAPAEATFTITVEGVAALINVEFGGLEQTYDGNPKLVTVTTDPAGVETTITYDGNSDAPVNAGTYTVSVQLPYGQPHTNVLTISRGSAEVSFVTNSLTQEIGFEDVGGTSTPVVRTPAAVETLPAGLDVEITYDGSADLPEGVGVYAVAATVADGNWTGSTTNTFTVTKATQEITTALRPSLKEYVLRARPLDILLFADADSGLPVTFAIDEETDSSTGASIDESFLTVLGPGTVKLIASQAGDDNWAAAEIEIIVKVTGTAAPLDVEYEGLEQTYDGNPKLVTVTTDPPGLETTITYNGETDAPVNAGTYAIHVQLPYDQFKTNVMTINKGSAEISFVTNSLTQEIGFEDVGGTNTPVVRTPAAVETLPAGLDVEITYDGSADLPEGVGVYAVAATVADGNWTGSATNIFTVNKAPQTITVLRLRPGDVYNIRGRPLDINLSAYATSELSVADNVEPVEFAIGEETDAATGAVIENNILTVLGPGMVQVIVSHPGDDNWASAETEITLDVVGTAAEILVFWENTEQIYDGNPKPVTITTDPSRLEATITYDGETNAPVNAGTYAVRVDLPYDQFKTNVLTIHKESAEVSFVTNSLTQEIGFEDVGGTKTPVVRTPAAVGTVPAGLDVEITYDGSTNLPQTVGEYPVVATVTDGNWTGSATNIFTVDKATQEIAVSQPSRTEYTIRGRPLDIALSANATSELLVTFAIGEGTDSTAGAAITEDVLTVLGPGMIKLVASQAGDDNWVSVKTEVTLNIVGTAAEIDVTWGGTEQTYDGNPKPVTVTTDPAGVPQTITYMPEEADSTLPPTQEAPVNAGRYVVHVQLPYNQSRTNVLTIHKGSADVSFATNSLTQTIGFEDVGGTSTPVVRTPAAVETVPAGLDVDITYDGSADLPGGVGVYAVAATVTDDNWMGSTTNTFTVNKATQEIVTTLHPDQTEYTLVGIPIQIALFANSTSGLPITFALAEQQPGAVISGNILTIWLADEDVEIVASQAGDDNWESAEETFTVQVTGESAQILAEFSDLEQTYDGNPKPVTVTTDPPGLEATITYNDEMEAPVGAGTYEVRVDLPYGQFRIAVLEIKKAVATINFATNSLTQELNCPVEDSPDLPTINGAEVVTTPANLNVSFLYGDSSSVPVEAGEHTVVAIVEDDNWTGSATNTFTVTKASQTIQTFLQPSLPVYELKGIPLAVALFAESTSRLPVMFELITPRPGVILSVDPNNVMLVREPGVIEIRAFQEGNSCWAAAETTFMVTIIGDPIDDAQVILENLVQVYDGTPKPVTVRTEPANLNTVVTYNGEATAPINAGTYNVRAVIDDRIHEGEGTDMLTIQPGTATVNLVENSLTQTFNNVTGVQVTTVPAGLGVEITYDGSTNLPQTVGEYPVVATVTDNNWTGSTTNTFTVNKATQEIVTTLHPDQTEYTLVGIPIQIALFANSTSGLPITFALAEQQPGAVISGNILTIWLADEDVEIVASQAGDDNWESAEKTFTVQVTGESAQIRAELSDLEQTYDGNPKPVTVTTEPSGLEATITYAGEMEAPVGAGTYEIRVDLPYGQFRIAVLEIKKAVATINFATNSLTQPFNNVTGVQVTTVPAGLDVEITYDGSTNLPQTVGEYPVVATVTDGNWTGSATNIFTVDKATQEIAVSQPSRTEYTIRGRPLDIALSANATSELLVTFAIGEGTDSTAGAAITEDVLTVLGPGMIKLVASQAGDDNWVSVKTEVTLNIVGTAAEIDVTWGGTEQTYDGNPKPVTVTTDPAGVPQTITYMPEEADSTLPPTQEAPVNAGRYVVHVQLPYNQSRTNVLTIHKGSADVSFATNSLTQTIGFEDVGGTSTPVVRTPAAVETVPAGLDVDITYDGSADLPGGVGVYAVAATVTDDNWMGSTTNTFTVNKATQEIVTTLHPDQTEYTLVGIPIQIALFANSTSGLPITFALAEQQPGAVISGNILTIWLADEDVEIVASQAGDDNWESAEETFTVQVAGESAQILAEFSDLEQTYDGNPKPVTVTTDPPGLEATITYNDEMEAPVGAGTYEVRVDLPYGQFRIAVLEIKKAVATINFATNSLTQELNCPVEDSPDLPTINGAEVVTTPANLNVSFLYGDSSIVPVEAGEHTVVAIVEDDNWTGSATNTFTVTKASQTIQTFLQPSLPVYELKGIPLAVALFAESTSRLPVMFELINPRSGVVLSVDPNNVMLVREPGVIEIRAFQEGNSCWAAAETTFMVTITGDPIDDAQVILENLVQVYDGTPKPVTVRTEPADLNTVVTYDDEATAPINAGTYNVRAVIDDRIHEGEGTDMLTIQPGTAAVNLVENSLTQPFNNVTGVQVTTVPAGLGVEITYDGSTNLPQTVGEYPVVVSVEDDNWTGSAVGTFTVAKASQEITLAGLGGYAPWPIAMDKRALGIPLPAATVTSGLPVTFEVNVSDSTGEATVSGNILTVTQPGNIVVIAHQAGDDSWLPAEKSFTVVVTGQGVPAKEQTISLTNPDGYKPWPILMEGRPLGIPLAATASSGLTPVTFEFAETLTAVIDSDGRVVVSVVSSKTGNTLTVKLPESVKLPPNAVLPDDIGLGVATVSGNILTVTQPGFLVVIAHQAGDEIDWLPAEAAFLVIVNGEGIPVTKPQLSIIGLNNAILEISVTGSPNATVAILSTDTLPGGTFTKVRDVTLDSNGNGSFTLPTTGSAGFIKAEE